MAEHPILYFPQQNFFDLVRECTNSGVLKLESYDKNTVFHVAMPSTDTEVNVPRQAFYLKVTTQPEPQQQLDVALQMVESLPTSMIRVVVLVAETDELAAFLFPLGETTSIKAAIIPPPTSKLFHSRSILETDILKNASVCIIGLGSGGSQVAVELAKAGVGRLVLVDYDRLELNNISRHACGLSDIGRLKTNAMKDLLLNKNPEALIETFDLNVDDTTDGNYPTLKERVGRCHLIIACTDTVQSRYNINTLSLELRVTTIYGKCSTRAAGGEVLRVRPGSSACLSCVYGKMKITPDETASFERLRKMTPAYVPDSDVEAQIQVGLSSDIAPISNMIVKLSLVELCRGKPSGISSLDEELRAQFYRWANRREQEFKTYPEGGFQRFDKPAILRWYPADIQPDPDCMTCTVFGTGGTPDESTAAASDTSFFGTP
jgi:molybdopterin/thiamine biosynthesis adenylyltransferase